MITNGLYKVTFATDLGEGYGVAHLQNGKIHGGDSMMSYVGSYAQNGDDFAADVKVNAHSIIPGMTSVLGVNSAELSLKGRATNNSAKMTGSAKAAPGVSFRASLSKLAD